MILVNLTPIRLKFFELRAAETVLSKEWELNGPLFLDITRQSRLLLPQIDFHFKFLHAKVDIVL